MDIRTDWITTQVKHLASYTNGYAFSPEDWGDEGTPIIRIQNLTNPENAPNRTMVCPSEKFRVESGDILIPWSGSIGVHQWTGETAWLNQHIFKVSPKDGIDKRYFWWLANYFVPKVAERAHGSTMQHLTKDAFGTFEVQLPPLATQTAIADYLDRKTAAIDALIAKKEFLIEELRKYLKAATTEAVMRGLSGKASVTPSDENWLGAVPPHWRIVKTARVLRYLKGAAVDKENLAVEGADDSRFLRTGDFWNIRGLSKDKAFVTDTDGLIWKSEGELVFCFDGFNSVAGAGTVGMARFDGAGYIDSHLEKIEVKDDSVAVRRYFEYVLASAFFEHEIVSRARGAIAFSAGYAKYDVSVPVPPITEQQAIVEHLDAVWSTVSPLIEAAKAAIDDLTRYRTALISEAVTGKISV